MASIPQVNKVLPISRGNPTFGSRSCAELGKQSLPADLGVYSDKVKDAQPLVATVTTEPSPNSGPSQQVLGKQVTLCLYLTIVVV